MPHESTQKRHWSGLTDPTPDTHCAHHELSAHRVRSRITPEVNSPLLMWWPAPDDLAFVYVDRRHRTATVPVSHPAESERADDPGPQARPQARPGGRLASRHAWQKRTRSEVGWPDAIRQPPGTEEAAWGKKRVDASRRSAVSRWKP